MALKALLDVPVSLTCELPAHQLEIREEKQKSGKKEMYFLYFLKWDQIAP